MKVIFDSDPPDVELIGSEEWRLLREERVLIDGHEVIIPPGFETDFGSVPDGLHRLIEKYGRQAKSYVLHDWLCGTEFFAWDLVSWDVRYRGSENRALCDRALLDGMTAQGVSWWKRRAIYGAVRIFGGLVWDSHKLTDTEGNRALYLNYINSARASKPAQPPVGGLFL